MNRTAGMVGVVEHEEVAKKHICLKSKGVMHVYAVFSVVYDYHQFQPNLRALEKN